MPRKSAARHSVRSTTNFKLLSIVLLCAAVVLAALTSGAGASAQAEACLTPTVQIITDPAGDQSGAPLANQSFDIRTISIAEDYRNFEFSRLVITMKVTSLTTLPPNGAWRTRFTFGGVSYFVVMETDTSSAVRYEYGDFGGTGGSLRTLGTAVSGTNSADGNIVITVNSSNVGNAAAGQMLTAMSGATQQFVGTPEVGGGYLGMDSTTTTSTYTLAGKPAACVMSTPTPTPTPTPGGGGGGVCNASGISATTDPAGDHNATIGTAQQDIREVLVAEPYFTDGSSKLVFTVKVESLDPNNLPANAIWKVYFNVGTTTHFVAAFNDPATGASFDYGAKDANGIDQTAGAADAGSFDGAAKSINIIVSNGKVGSPGAGQQLAAVTGTTQLLIGSGEVGGSLQQVDTTTPGSYTLVGNAACAPDSTPTPTPTPTTGAGPEYTIYQPPSGMGQSAGEPSVGINWKTGKVFFIASTQTLRVTFDDCVQPATAKWEDVSFPTTNRATLDPILYTDSATGRTFVSQLLGKASSTVYTDNDAGVNGQGVGDWIQSQGSGINSGVDHQTLGGGPFAAPLTRDPADTTLYPNAVYYASQDAAVAQAAVSLDGGQTFGPAVPMYNLLQCGGIHGHLKVAPDGTAYVPNKQCGSTQGVVVSENNGASWVVRPVTGSTASSGIKDPSVGIATDGRIYFGGTDGNSLPFTAVSRDKGVTWTNLQRIGAGLGIVNATFPQMIAGDPDRAAFAFLGSTTGGDGQSPITAGNPFKGAWHLYIATTYDGGVTWTTINATPGDPVQQGSICNSGTVVCEREPNDRNLLDFNDIQIDKQGRPYAAYADGCITSSCINGDYRNNDYAARASIARQSGGKTLFAAFDPTGATVPKSPAVTAQSDAAGVHLSWTPPDDGGSPITGYKVYRRAQGAPAPTLLASLPATQLSYDDTTADPATTYLYHVRAVNIIGESDFCPGSEVVPSLVPDHCNLPGVRVTSDPAGDTTPPPPVAPTSVDIRSVSVAEPFFGAGVNKLVITLKVGTGAAPASSQWYVIWSRPPGTPDAATFDRNYVAMKTSATGAISYEYGKVAPPNANLPTRVGDADAGTFDPATGTITITISNSKLDNVGVGQGLNTLDARSFWNRADGQPVTGLQATDTTPAGGYELVGNAACEPNEAPVAVLTATPKSGLAPLNVAFNAAGSTDADGDAIVEYTFNFGDGASETRTTSQLGDAAKTAAHTYTTPGSYRAFLSVKDAAGNSSLNVAEELITVNAGGCAVNWALASNGASASASSTSNSRDYSPANTIDGDNTGVGWEQGGGWNDDTRDLWPDWLDVNFNGAQAVNEIRVYTLQNDYSQPVVPDETTDASYYGISDFEVQAWDGTQFVTVPGGLITGNTKAMRVITLGAPVTTSAIRIKVNAGRIHFSRIVEVEAIGCAAP
ncbi:MAG TPA: PKD domain-containing protein [Pyrinomonadaceae bacterium]